MTCNRFFRYMLAKYIYLFISYLISINHIERINSSNVIMINAWKQSCHLSSTAAPLKARFHGIVSYLCAVSLVEKSKRDCSNQRIHVSSTR